MLSTKAVVLIGEAASHRDLMSDVYFVVTVLCLSAAARSQPSNNRMTYPSVSRAPVSMSRPPPNHPSHRCNVRTIASR